MRLVAAIAAAESPSGVVWVWSRSGILRNLSLPFIVFDHIHKKVGLAGGDPTVDKALAAALRAQIQLVGAAVGTPPPADSENEDAS